MHYTVMYAAEGVYGAESVPNQGKNGAIEWWKWIEDGKEFYGALYDM